jgi:uncharacterized membrane protein YdjX (TVP38/TMEM64 family)
VDLVTWLVEQLQFLATVFGSDVLLGLTLLALTAAVMASGVPGLLLPISFSSGALLGGWFGMAVVVVGAVAGSQLFFLASRHWLAERIRRRWGAKLERFDGELKRRGFYYLLGLRLIGVPHLPVTAASALSPIRARHFALATMLGLLPAITIASMAGSAI